MSEWQDISTAPKDGTWFLAATTDPHPAFVGMIEETMWIVRWDDGHWRIELDGQSARPTHWQPLPVPPSSSPARDE